MVPLPGSAKPIASNKQFIELAVNIPEHEPQVGHAERSTFSESSSLTVVSAPFTMASTKSSLMSISARRVLPASIGPPDTKITGIFKRSAASIIPGVILSQLEIQIMASAQCALTMYSTESAIKSRDGSEYSMPP